MKQSKGSQVAAGQSKDKKGIQPSGKQLKKRMKKGKLHVSMSKENKQKAQKKIKLVKNPRKGGPLQGIEPSTIDIFEAYPDIAQGFKDVGWYHLCTSLKGYHKHVALTFSKTFDGDEETIGELVLYVLECTIASSCNLIIEGER